MKENRGGGVWSNRTVIAVGVSGFLAHFSYEMGIAVLSALLTVMLGFLSPGAGSD